MSRTIVWRAAVVTFASFVLLLVTVWASFDQAVRERNDRAVVSARMVERGLTRTLESVETTLVAIAEDARTALREGDVAIAGRRIHEALRFAPHLRQIVIARQATVLADSNGNAGDELDLERIGLAPDPGGGLSHGLRIGRRLDGRFLPTRATAEGPAGSRSFISVGVSIAAPEGADPVVLVAALNTAYLEAFFADVAVGEHGAYALARLDGGRLLGTAPAPPGAEGSWQDRLRSVVLDGADERFFRDGPYWWPESSTAVRLSSRYPVGVVVRYSHWDTFSDWADRNRVMLLTLVAAMATVVGSVGLLLRDTIRRATLQNQVRLLFHAVEQSPIVVVITGANGAIRYVNPAFSSLLGFSPQEVIGQNPRFFRSDRTPRATYVELWNTILAGQAWRGEFLNRTKGGTIVHVSSTISAVRNAAGVITHYVGMMADITEAKRIEQERETLLIRLDRARADLQSFAEVSAHHLQEPSRRLVIFAQRLKSRLAGRLEDQDVDDSLTFIEEQAGRLRGLVRDIQLYLAADQPLGEVRVTDAGAVVRQVLDRMADEIREAGAAVTLGDLPPVWADASRLHEIFAILIGNAVQHGRRDRPVRIQVVGDKAGPRIRYRVIDDGPGIPEPYRERVFRVFERLAPKSDDGGTGIGLAVVRRAVESAGGRVGIEETPGGGTTVTIELPDAADP